MTEKMTDKEREELYEEMDSSNAWRWSELAYLRAFKRVTEDFREVVAGLKGKWLGEWSIAFSNANWQLDEADVSIEHMPEYGSIGVRLRASVHESRILESLMDYLPLAEGTERDWHICHFIEYIILDALDDIYQALHDHGHADETATAWKDAKIMYDTMHSYCNELRKKANKEKEER